MEVDGWDICARHLVIQPTFKKILNIIMENSVTFVGYDDTR